MNKIGSHRIRLVYAVVGTINIVVLSFIYIAYLQHQENTQRFATIQSHLEIVHAANALSSYVKRAEGHMLMYIILRNQPDRNKFYARHQKVKEIHSLLAEELTDDTSHALINSMQSNVDGLLQQGNLLLKMLDQGESLTTQSHALRTFHNFSSEIRNLGVGLVDQLTKELAIDNHKSANTSYQHMILLMLLSTFIIALLLFVLIYAKRFFAAEERMQAMRHRFQQTQKLESLGTLVGGIAHGFNNMLASIIGNVYLAKKISHHPSLTKNLENIESISFRAADMIKQLLTFARKDQTRMVPLALVPYLKNTLKLIRISIPEDIRIKQEIYGQHLAISGDATQLHQVLLNLIINACDAVEHVPNPCITIKLESFQADKLFFEKHTAAQHDHYAHLSIQDNGCGMDAEQRLHIFEPFFTTKDQSKGAGLGLSMVFGAIKSHHGSIEVESVLGEGSTFHIYIPMLEQEKSKTPPNQLISKKAATIKAKISSEDTIK